MNRRSFLGFVIGCFAFVRALAEDVQRSLKLSEASLQGLSEDKTISDENLFTNADVVPTLPAFCDPMVGGGEKCGSRRQANQYCGNCKLFYERSLYKGNVVGKCRQLAPQGKKTHVWGHYYCAKYFVDKNLTYEIVQ
ncbi:MAG: hypothetical protein NDI61_05220 [Bdellovibrionaceae bacterium]|nr:hypothetical protein [Pseudobdellovibrionaceae bacterium]